MNVSPLVRACLMSLAERGLDTAGNLILPGAWPLISAALSPVIDRLKLKFGGQDVTSSKNLAEQAADAFEADYHLQAMFNSGLRAQLAPHTQGQSQINADIQTLMSIAAGNQQALDTVLDGVQGITHRLDDVAKQQETDHETLTDIRTMVARLAQGDVEVRAIALRAVGPVADVLQQQANRIQIRANELLEDGAPDRALNELREGERLVAFLLSEAPSDVVARTQLGFIYKTSAQAAEALDNTDLQEEFTSQADQIFQAIATEQAAGGGDPFDLANVIQGKANLAHERGELHEAVAYYRMVLQLTPEHLYALHDLFLAYAQLTAAGQPHLIEMRQTLDELERRVPPGHPGFGTEKISELEAMMSNLDQATQHIAR